MIPVRHTLTLVALMVALAFTLGSCANCTSCVNVKPIVEEVEEINELGFQLCISNLPDPIEGEESCGEVKVEFVLVLQ